MPDRLIRDELLESERWLDLPSDTHRLAYFGFLVKRIDDFGNMEGGIKGIFRFLSGFTQVKTQEATALALSHLCDADMIRAYKDADGREFYHLPRFRPHRQYLVRKYPKSPWDFERKLGKDRRVIERGLAKEQALTENMSDTSHARSMHVAEGVGVGVGVGISKRKVVQNPPRDARAEGNNALLKKGNSKVNNETRNRWDIDEKTVDAKGRELGLSPKPGESYPDYTRRLWNAVNAHSRGST